MTRRKQCVVFEAGWPRISSNRVRRVYGADDWPMIPRFVIELHGASAYIHNYAWGAHCTP